MPKQRMQFKGIPFFVLAYDTVYVLLLVTIILNICNIIYCFVLFSAATKIKNNLGDFLMMVVNDGFLLALLTAIPGLLIIAVDVACIFFIIRVMYDNVYKRMGLNKALFIMAILCFATALVSLVVSIIALSHSHSRNEKLLDGIRDAMDNYGLDSKIKTKLDKMQITFQCCGSKKYTEWYEIRWFDASFVDNTTRLLGGEVPFSCCSMRAIYPCIHHGIENTKSVYFYNPEANISISTSGCHEVLVKRKMHTSWIIFGLLFLAAVLQIIDGMGMRLIQTAHFALGRIEDGRHEYKAWLIGIQKPAPIRRPVVTNDEDEK